MQRSIVLSILWTAIMGLQSLMAANVLDTGWEQPPMAARTRAYWWWLNGNVTSNAITRDLEEMRAKGWGGALLCDAGGAEQQGNDKVPHGPTFFSPEWRGLYRHTLNEASRLGLEISLSIQSGWNLGGPMTTKEDAVKKLTWSATNIVSSGAIKLKLPTPPVNDAFYRDIAVLAWRINPAVPTNRPPLKNLVVKSLRARPSIPGPDGWAIANSAPPTGPALFEEEPTSPGEEDARVEDVVNLTSHLSTDGLLEWDAPAGSWRIVRMGYTLADSRHISTHSDGWSGYALDVMDQGALKRYWDQVVEPLIADAGPHTGKTLKYLHTDSWEVDVFNWTPAFLKEFRHRRGYDALPWLPVITGAILNNREECNRFLHDFRKTFGELAIDHHYRPYQKWAARHGLGIHPESGGPHYTPIDAQRCLGLNDVPMSEFWAESPTHRRTEVTRFFLKQPASAAHTYGRKYVAAEGFTTIGPHWQETLWDNLQPSFNHALVEGLNRLVWHAFVCSPQEMGLPGQQYFAGTHMNPNVTWWEKSGPFMDYLNRCQFVLQQGLPSSDVLYYYGDHVPNYAQLRASDPTGAGPGYDYDVITEDALLTRLKYVNGHFTLPDGVTYRLLVLPDREVISLPVLRKLKSFARAGAPLLGPKPTQASGLARHAQRDKEVQQLANEVWNHPGVISGQNARQVLQAQGLAPDFEVLGTGSEDTDRPNLEYIHRRDGAVEIYFVANRQKKSVRSQCTFRVTGRAPELWNPVTGERRFGAAYQIKEGRTTLPLDFAPAGSWFVVFRAPASDHPATASDNAPSFSPMAELTGSWKVSFDPRWGGPAVVDFPQLANWTTRSEPGIKYYSGTATYRQTFTAPATPHQGRVILDLGLVRELAEVKLNGKTCGIVWAPPFQVDVTDALKAGENQLEIEVVNFWPNRIIGDAFLPADQRLTHTNIRKLTRETPLMDSGLFGPVRLLERMNKTHVVPR